MRSRTPIARLSQKRLASLKGKPVFSTISKRSESPRKLNPVAKAKRTARYRKMLSGKEYKAARAEAFERAGNQCEWNDSDRFGLGTKTDSDPARFVTPRCGMTVELHAHHLRYPKSRPLAATDLVVLCDWHHRAAESQKMHKTRMF